MVESTWLGVRRKGLGDRMDGWGTQLPIPTPSTSLFPTDSNRLSTTSYWHLMLGREGGTVVDRAIGRGRVLVVDGMWGG